MGKCIYARRKSDEEYTGSSLGTNLVREDFKGPGKKNYDESTDSSLEKPESINYSSPSFIILWTFLSVVVVALILGLLSWYRKNIISYLKNN